MNSDKLNLHAQMEISRRKQALSGLLKPAASLPLVLLLLASICHGQMRGAAPTPVGMAQAFQARMAAAPSGGALLTTLQTNLDVPSAAMIRAMSSPQAFSAAVNFIAGAQTEQEPRLGADTAAALRTMYKAIQADPEAIADLSVAASQLATMDAEDLAIVGAMFDGSLAQQAAMAPASIPVYAGDGPAAVRAHSTLSPAPRPQPQQALAPASDQTTTTTSLSFGEQLVEPAAEDAPEAVVAAAAAPAPAVGRIQLATDESRAAGLVAAILRLDPMDHHQAEQGIGAARQFGRDQTAAVEQSERLQQPLKQKRANEASIFEALASLQAQVGVLNPKYNDPSWWRIMLSKVPLINVKSPEQNYADKYDGAQEAIRTIVTTLETGREGLLADNQRLRVSRSQMMAVTARLQKAVDSGKLVYQGLKASLADPSLSAERKAFIKEDVLITLARRILDLQAQLAVNQQGVMATKILVDNNEVLADSVNSTINVIPAALQVALDIAHGLDLQRSVSGQMSAANKIGADIITQNAESLSTQSAEIQRQALEGSLPVAVLQDAFDKLTGTIQSLDQFREQAVPKIDAEIEKVGKVTADGKAALDKMKIEFGLK